MFDIPTQVYGLLFDILGAFVIVIPDIPFLRRYHQSGRLRDSLVLLETKGISRHEVGYDDLLAVITGIAPPKESGFKRKPDYLRKQMTRLQANPLEHVYAFYTVDSQEEMASEQYSDIPYDGLRLAIQDTIRGRESRIRAVGFSLLALGFLIQIFGIMS